MATVTKISPEERQARSWSVEGALASVRLEGLEPSDEAKALFQEFIDGELSEEELGEAFDRLLDRLYGPVRLPGNERT